MYYKVKANNNLKKVPIVYCKSKNIDRIYQEMQSNTMILVDIFTASNEEPYGSNNFCYII